MSAATPDPDAAAQARGQTASAGGIALSLLAAPLNVQILRTLAQEAMSLLDLRRTAGSPPQSTMRLYSRTLSELGVIDRRRQAAFPGSVEYRITGSGRDLLAVAKALEIWLSIGSQGSPALGAAAKSATKALVEGWSTEIVRAVAARPLSLTELNKAIPKISYPSLERRLNSMRLAGLVAPQAGDRRGTPYGATDWLRRAVIPVASAAAWERRHRPLGAQPISRPGVEAAFLLALPLLEMGATFSGRFRLAVEVQGGGSPSLAGVLVCFEKGAVVSRSSRLEGKADASISGSSDAWFRRMSGIAPGGLEVSGDTVSAEELLDALAGIGSTLPSGR